MLESAYVPVAVNCSVPPTVTVGFTGVTAIDVRVGPTTLTFTPADAAPMLALSSVARARSVAAPSAVGIQV